MAGEDDKPDEPKKEEAEEAEKPTPSSPWPSERKSEKPPAVAEAKVPPKKETPNEDGTPEKKAWGKPLDRFDRVWTKLEARLCAFVLVLEIFTLVMWIALKALSSTGRDGAGALFREMLTAAVMGTVVHLATRKRGALVHQIATTIAVIAFWIIGGFFGDLGVDYFANLLAWMQNASFLVFFGGVSELAKRLTLWLALLGASVATAQGKHINVDVVMRFLSPRARVPVAVLGWVTAAVVSGAAAWGFYDDLAVEDFHAPADMSAAAKIERVNHDIGIDLFLARKQIALDLRSLPKVLGGTPYGKFLTPKDWNEWLRDGGWENHFAAEDVKALELPEDGSIDYRTPAVTSIPGGSTEKIHMILVPVLNLVFPFGLLVIAIRFILRSLLALSGWVKVDPNAAHGEEELAHLHDESPQADALEAATKEAQG